MIALYTVAAQAGIGGQSVRARDAGRCSGWRGIAVNPLGRFGGGVEILPFMVAVVVVAGIATANRRAYMASIQDRAEQDARLRRRGTAGHCPRTARCRRPHHGHHQRAGRGGGPRPVQPSGGGGRIPAGDQGREQGGVEELRAILNVLRQADDADPTQPTPVLASSRPSSPGPVRPGDDVHGDRGSGPAACLVVRRRLPHRPGVADQRHPARLAGHRRGLARLPPRRTADRRDRVGSVVSRSARPTARAEATGSPGRASAPPPSAAPSRPAPDPAAASGSRPGCPSAAARGPGRVGTWKATTAQEGARGYPVIRVLLADDQALIRAGFHVLIDAADDLQVVGEATDGAQAVDLARRQRADVVLMDIRMPGVDGLEATRRISADDDLAGVKVIILTTFESDESTSTRRSARGPAASWSRTPSPPTSSRRCGWWPGAMRCCRRA